MQSQPLSIRPWIVSVVVPSFFILVGLLAINASRHWNTVTMKGYIPQYAIDSLRLTKGYNGSHSDKSTVPIVIENGRRGYVINAMPVYDVIQERSNVAWLKYNPRAEHQKVYVGLHYCKVDQNSIPYIIETHF
jgi:hypothetical protein